MSSVESEDNIQENEEHIKTDKEAILKKIASELKICNDPESLAALLTQALPLHISKHSIEKASQ